MRSIFLDHIGQLSFERHNFVNLSSLASAMNILFGMLRAVTGMTTTVTTGLTAAEVEGTGGAIWLESEWVALTGYMRVKNDSPGMVHTCMDAAGCVDESSWLIWVRVT